ncbi:MAG TPA: cytochrome b N-terminal domain-containing protein, partial [Pyrinomonadaceae bacterium]|nr:cytochrome b N-terminal domain-containing protein [Pyrinomonadaceae bacterium]
SGAWHSRMTSRNSNVTRRDYTASRWQVTQIGSWLDATWGIVLVLLTVQFLTGVLLAFYYVPSTDHAYATVEFIQNVLSSGAWIRSLHHYGSQWLAVFLFLHVVRLFLSEAYVDKNAHWIASVVLLGLVMAGGGTGYSLPWDARAFFSTRIAEGLVGGLPFVGRLGRLWLLGGSEISTLTLSRFFALHVLVIPGLIVGVIVWRRLTFDDPQRNTIAAGLVFVALALWCLKVPAPLGPSTTQMTADFIPRPGAQFLWLYQSLKYVPGGLASILGLVLPVIALFLLIFLRRLRGGRLIGGVILGVGALLIITMTTAAYISDYKNPRVREQLAMTNHPDTPPVLYVKWCVNCHGRNGEGGQQGQLRFPPLTGVASKPRRTVDDIVGLLKDPEAYGLQPPMRSFADKLTEPQMKEIAEWVHRLR